MRLRILLFALLLCGSSNGFSQQEAPADTLVYTRKLFHSAVSRDRVLLSKKKFTSLLESAPSNKWSRKNKLANILLPVGPLISTGGVYLAYDAIKGVPMVATIDGKDYPYVVRSLPKLLGGLALFVTGLSLVESANETKMNAVRYYNEEYIKKQKTAGTALNWRAGVTPSGGLGVSVNF